ncbi:Uu.00g073400.m01.CDS01 [Anthostomella pinea]|uniref:Uu.00g073400.m01.CDS01 n=1 Tax=Anthostomella pinea TaxID=933095 RepID=A0AAI8VW55_9PEZI|nr:Uu.00g073400.m01.CDS01 [Anthostomella pinea]
MAPSVVHLPDGQGFTVTPVFSGLFFKSNELNKLQTPFPSGWTVVLHSESEDSAEDQLEALAIKDDANEGRHGHSHSHIHRYTTPTLQNDTISISSISSPSSSEYKPHASPSRQIALMLYVTLYWYFQQPEPLPYLDSDRSKHTPLEAKPRADWRIRVKRAGVFHSKNMIPKMERMGLVTTFDTAVGTSVDENSQGWDQMFVTRRMFWQIHSGLFLFTLQPIKPHPGSPVSSRPTSPVRNEGKKAFHSPAASLGSLAADVPGGPIPTTVSGAPSTPIGPYYSSSHLPTFYPPAPLQYTMTNNIRHPLRQKPPRMGEIFYSRFIPSVGRYLSFRAASLSPKPVPHLGPVGQGAEEHAHLRTLTDSALLETWLSNPRVTAFWGEYHPHLISEALRSRHSFPAIGMWDGVPFGYFEIYWVKEDALGMRMGNDAQDFDRGLHVLVGEEWARRRVPYWLTSLVHWCWQTDYRTMNIYLEPRVDNHRFIQHLQDAGFAKERQLAFPHKQAWLCRLRRDAWDGPAL